MPHQETIPDATGFSGEMEFKSMPRAIADNSEYRAALKIAQAHPGQATMMAVRTALGKMHHIDPGECDRLWGEALRLLDGPNFGIQLAPADDIASLTIDQLTDRAGAARTEAEFLLAESADTHNRIAAANAIIKAVADEIERRTARSGK